MDPECISTIAAKIHQAANSNSKVAMFHLQVLLNAVELAAVDPIEFCRKVKMRDSFATEFRKMLGLSRLMREQGIEVK
jgi:hypothetical protein